MIEKKTWNVIETLEKKSQSSDEEVKEISKQALWTIKDQQNSCKYIIIQLAFKQRFDKHTTNVWLM